jgi:hypothetical protein
MSSFNKNQNIDLDQSSAIVPYIPYNRGYIINGRKIYGHQDEIEKGKNMKLISQDNHIHIWFRRGYLEKKLNDKETDYDGLFVTHRCSLVTTRAMMPCPAEIHNSGICLDRFDSKHNQFYYHFTKYDCHGNIVIHDNMVMCKYKNKGKWYCWERYNSKHCNVFTHI